MENNFLDDAPEAFEPTCLFAWIENDKPVDLMPAVLSYHYKMIEGSHYHNFDPPVYALCQKWRKMEGAFPSWNESDASEVWVRVPVQE